MVTIHILVRTGSFALGLKRSWAGQKRTVLFAEEIMFCVPFANPNATMYVFIQNQSNGIKLFSVTIHYV